MTQNPTQSLADSLFETLRAQILSGEFAPESRLPAERQLAATLDTNRNTLREAIRKLEQANLVTVRHGQGVTVSDYRQTARMDILEAFFEHGTRGLEKVRLVADLLLLRIGALDIVASLAAERATAEDLARLRTVGALQIGRFEAGDRHGIAHGEAEWLNALVDAGHSLFVRWFANDILDVFTTIAVRFPTLWLNEPTYPDHIRGVLDAVEAKDSARAQQVMNAYHAKNDARIYDLLGPLLASAPAEAQGDKL
ncbi:MAG: GntR family transcriptional repressor for pyruvate dehydrogenase complex [Myxococcota bacterium]